MYRKLYANDQLIQDRLRVLLLITITMNSETEKELGTFFARISVVTIYTNEGIIFLKQLTDIFEQVYTSNLISYTDYRKLIIPNG